MQLSTVCYMFRFIPFNKAASLKFVVQLKYSIIENTKKLFASWKNL